jgi:hypothetical protein
MIVSKKVGHRKRASSVSRRILRSKKSYKKNSYRKKHAKTERRGARGYSSISRRRLRKSKSGSKKRYTQRGRYGGSPEDGSPEDMIEIKYDSYEPSFKVKVSEMLSVAKKIADMDGVNQQIKTITLPSLESQINEKELYPNVARTFVSLFLPQYIRSKRRSVNPATKLEALNELFTPSFQLESTTTASE